MRRLTPIFFALVMTVVGRDSWSAEPDAAELASLIDRSVENRLKAEGIPPAEPAVDAEFLRRVYLDLHGVVPTAEQAERFLADTRPDRRSRLIDALLDDPRYGEYLADLWQSYLVSPLADDRRARADGLRKWLAGQFNARTWDRITTELLTATGKQDENPAVNYLIEGRLPRTVPDLTDLTSRYFLGVRLSCAQCHDHPFVAWKQQEFWGMAAFFTQVQTPGKPKLVYQVGVQDNPELTLDSLKKDGPPDGFQSRPPTFLGGELPPADRQTPHRVVLAAWLTSAKNPYFARAMANRTWWRLFGRGLVSPVDDMHSANPPSHPELLDLLAGRFAESGFDHKFLTRAIVSSRAYQRTSRSGDAPDKQAVLFGRMSGKVLSAGQLYDSLVAALGPPIRKAGSPADTRAEFVQFFSDDGDPDPTAYRRGIPHLLRQMNAQEFAGRNVGALATRLAKPSRSTDDVSGDLFLTILARRPTADEQKLFRTHANQAGSLETAARELAWALLLTSEFSLNR